MVSFGTVTMWANVHISPIYRTGIIKFFDVQFIALVTDVYDLVSAYDLLVLLALMYRAPTICLFPSIEIRAKQVG